jgi:hypothetical protein
MFGLPADFNTDLLVGRTLELICFSQNTINLHFDEKLTIVVRSSLKYLERTAKTASTIEVPAFQSNLMQLLEHCTTKVYGDNEGTLTLEFEDGQILQCLDDSTSYESYEIIQGGNRIIV